jgi:hypothetical protein
MLLAKILPLNQAPESILAKLVFRLEIGTIARFSRFQAARLNRGDPTFSLELRPRDTKWKLKICLDLI